MRSMQCNAEFGYQLRIRSGTKENHGNPWSGWPVIGPSGCKLTSSQQSDIEYASPNISPCLWGCFIINTYTVCFTDVLYSYNLDKQHTKTHLESVGLSISRSKQIAFPLRAKHVNAICKFVTIVYYFNYNNSGHYPSSCFFLFKTQLNSIGLSVPHRRHITSSLRSQQVCDDGILI
jgi:hypothetical protein